MGKTYQLIVNGINGEKKTIDVANSEEAFNNTTVEEFKKKLLEKLPGNTEPSELRLLYTSKQLDDGSKLSDYGIKDKAILMLVLRMPGGQICPMNPMDFLPPVTSVTARYMM